MKASGADMSDELYALSVESFQLAHKYPSCFVNGVSFISQHRNNQRITQNSGVCVPVEDVNYYGRMEDIIMPNYKHNFRIVLFKCIWYVDKYDASQRVHNDKITGATSAYTAKSGLKKSRSYLQLRRIKSFTLMIMSKVLNGKSLRNAIIEGFGTFLNLMLPLRP